MSHINFVVLFLLVPCIISFEQDLFTTKFERANIVSFNHDYLYDAKMVSFKYNRTQAVINATFSLKKEINSSLKLEIQAYKFMSNEYRYFPLRFAINLCQAVNSNEFGFEKFYKCGNLTSCAPSKGTYHICNFSPEAKKYPPLIPEGDYLVDLKIFDSSTEVAFIQAYGDIKNKFL